MVRRLLIAFLPLYVIVLTAETPLDVVTRVRNAHPDLPGNRDVTLQALKEIAVDPTVHGGILRKTSGNNCGGYSCDHICYADGSHYDVFADWENVASPTWNYKGTINPTLCEMQGTVPNPPPAEDCNACKLKVVELNNKVIELEQKNANLEAENKRVYAQLVEWDARLQQCEKDKAELQHKLDNVTCKASIFGIRIPCTVVK